MYSEPKRKWQVTFFFFLRRELDKSRQRQKLKKENEKMFGEFMVAGGSLSGKTGGILKN